MDVYKVIGTCPRYDENVPGRGNDLRSEACGPLMRAPDYPEGVMLCIRAIQVAANVKTALNKDVGQCEAEGYSRSLTVTSDQLGSHAVNGRVLATQERFLGGEPVDRPLTPDEELSRNLADARRVMPEEIQDYL